MGQKWPGKIVCSTQKIILKAQNLFALFYFQMKNEYIPVFIILFPVFKDKLSLSKNRRKVFD